MGKIFGTKEMRILMLGLDAAGKTSKFGGHVPSLLAQGESRGQSMRTDLPSSNPLQA